MRTESCIRDHVDRSSEQTLQILPQRDEVQQTAPGLHGDKHVEVAVGPGLATDEGTEDAHVMSAMASSQAKDRVALRNLHIPAMVARLVARWHLRLYVGCMWEELP